MRQWLPNKNGAIQRLKAQFQMKILIFLLQIIDWQPQKQHREEEALFTFDYGKVEIWDMGKYLFI